MNEIKIKPDINELYKLNEFISENIPNSDFKLELMVEEIFVNIVKYSGCSDITVTIDKEDKIQFIDNGIEFNPLEHKSSDPPQSIDEAHIGGVGIVFIKEIADEITYEYTDNKNHLTIRM